jgi:hypothetical protein
MVNNYVIWKVPTVSIKILYNLLTSYESLTHFLYLVD